MLGRFEEGLHQAVELIDLQRHTLAFRLTGPDDEDRRCMARLIHADDPSLTVMTRITKRRAYQQMGLWDVIAHIIGKA
ncbi:hypothetical protein GCM10027040_34050 [Halomonas shantousis]